MNSLAQSVGQQLAEKALLPVHLIRLLQAAEVCDPAVEACEDAETTEAEVVSAASVKPLIWVILSWIGVIFAPALSLSILNTGFWFDVDADTVIYAGLIVYAGTVLLSIPIVVSLVNMLTGLFDGVLVFLIRHYTSNYTLLFALAYI